MDVGGTERVFGCREKEITLKDRRKSPICVWGGKQHMLIT